MQTVSVCEFNMLVTCNKTLGESLLDQEPRGITSQPQTKIFQNTAYLLFIKAEFLYQRIKSVKYSTSRNTI